MTVVGLSKVRHRVTRILENGCCCPIACNSCLAMPANVFVGPLWSKKTMLEQVIQVVCFSMLDVGIVSILLLLVICWSFSTGVVVLF